MYLFSDNCAKSYQAHEPYVAQKWQTTCFEATDVTNQNMLFLDTSLQWIYAQNALNQLSLKKELHHDHLDDDSGTLSLQTIFRDYPDYLTPHTFVCFTYNSSYEVLEQTT